jgi:hypothetical protein
MNILLYLPFVFIVSVICLENNITYIWYMCGNYFEIYTYIFYMRSWNETKINWIGIQRNLFDSVCNVALTETVFHGITCRKNKNTK